MSRQSYDHLIRSSPHWMLYHMIPRQWRMRFIGMNQAAYHASTFLDERVQRPDDRSRLVDFPESDLGSNTALPTHFIFHIAFCGSTLLTRCFEASSACMVLREPLVLLQLAELRRLDSRQFSDGLLRHMASVATVALGRGFAHHRAVLIKPSNLVTGLAPWLMGDFRSRAVLLFEGLQSFLLSCAKKPPATQSRLLELPHRLPGCLGQSRLPRRALIDAQRDVLKSSALAWLLQMRCMADLDSSTRLLGVDFDQFLEDSPAGLAAIGEHFGLPDESWDTHCLGWNAKNPSCRYDRETRRIEQDQVTAILGEKLGQTIDWLERQFPGETASLSGAILHRNGGQNWKSGQTGQTPVRPLLNMTSLC